MAAPAGPVPSGTRARAGEQIERLGIEAEAERLDAWIRQQVRNAVVPLAGAGATETVEEGLVGFGLAMLIIGKEIECALAAIERGTEGRRREMRNLVEVTKRIGTPSVKSKLSRLLKDIDRKTKPKRRK